MSGLGGGAPPGIDLVDGRRPTFGLGVERIFLPDMFRNPNKDWPVSVTPLVVADGGGGSGTARLFPENASSGVAFHLRVPDEATKLHVRIPYRARFSHDAGATLAPRLYARTGDDQEWCGPVAVGLIHVPPNNLYQAVTFPLLLRSLSLEGGDYAQFLLVRHSESRSDTLESDWLLFGLGLTFA